MTDHFEKLLEIVDPITDKYLEAGIDQLNQHEIIVFSVWRLEAEVNNGGFRQFFWNSSGDLAEETVDSLMKLGAPETASIVQAAIANFGDHGVPKDRERRQVVLEELEQAGRLKLDSLDSEFYTYPDNLELLMYTYAQSNGMLKNI